MIVLRIYLNIYFHTKSAYKDNICLFLLSTFQVHFLLNVSPFLFEKYFYLVVLIHRLRISFLFIYDSCPFFLCVCIGIRQRMLMFLFSNDVLFRRVASNTSSILIFHRVATTPGIYGSEIFSVCKYIPFPFRTVQSETISFIISSPSPHVL